MKGHSPAIAFAVATLGIALFSGMDAFMKGLALSIGTYNALLWRTLAGGVLGAAIFYGTGRKFPARSVLHLHVRRGILSAIMGFLFFWGLARVPLAQGIALSFVAPIIALYLAALLLKERITHRAVLASLLGFSGVVVILAGQARADLGQEAFLGAIAILASAFLYAYNIILMRQQALVAGPIEVAFFMSLVTTGCFLVAAPFLAELPPPGELPAIFAAALLAFCSLMLLTWAYARAEAQHLAPVEYTAFIWAALYGLLFFDEAVRPLTLVGAAMIVAACLAAVRGRPPTGDIETGVHP
ncbi:DMT family transporter [Sphingosinicella rhizophila]|uniref:DMT family transporter n=1 Tax=Sphingosinicella rhizophila TaxID=3050082 RepID=A0ABU3QC45_9SPHN|nr:DMT family transporter [Sphingosinicella sp. GR2756]MDT9600912.1 DMT family transporter [Sphingosinicella sp. GR2756]